MKLDDYRAYRFSLLLGALLSVTGCFEQPTIESPSKVAETNFQPTELPQFAFDYRLPRVEKLISPFSNFSAVEPSDTESNVCSDEAQHFSQQQLESLIVVGIVGNRDKYWALVSFPEMNPRTFTLLKGGEKLGCFAQPIEKIDDHGIYLKPSGGSTVDFIPYEGAKTLINR